jgi:hypothetical protein
MAYSAEDVDDIFSTNGSFHSLKAIHPVDIHDVELAFFWGKARDALKELERAEDEIVRVLDHRYSRGWGQG